MGLYHKSNCMCHSRENGNQKALGMMYSHTFVGMTNQYFHTFETH
jgi:hypothetical protein